MNIHRHIIDARTSVGQRVHEDFGMRDNRSRKIGYCYIIWKVQTHITKRDGALLLPFVNTVHFKAVGFSTREGRIYGHGSEDVHDVSIMGVTKKIKKKMKASRQRYKRRYGYSAL